MEHAFELGAANTPTVRMPSDVDRSSPGTLISRELTAEEMQRYGISHPLRAELVADLNEGLTLEEIAERHGRPLLEVAQKLVWWWPRIVMHLDVEVFDRAKAMHKKARAIPGIQAPPPNGSVSEAAEGSARETREEAREVAKQAGKRTGVGAILTREYLEEKLTTHSAAEIARELGCASSTVDYYIRRHGVANPRSDGQRKPQPVTATAAPKPHPKGLAPMPQVPEPEPTPAPAGLHIRVARAGESSAVLQRDLRAVLGLLEQADRPYNLVLTLEEAV